MKLSLEQLKQAIEKDADSRHRPIDVEQLIDDLKKTAEATKGEGSPEKALH